MKVADHYEAEAYFPCGYGIGHCIAEGATEEEAAKNLEIMVRKCLNDLSGKSP